MDETWEKAQKWEKEWHGICVNSLNEELKQLVYAEMMGIKRVPNVKTPYSFDLKGKTVIDIGSGPYSLLLKCVNLGQGYAVDPLIDSFPQWVKDRYSSAGIISMSCAGEDMDDYPVVDEVWIYNVLEHVKDPKKIIENALGFGKIVRIFEWLDTKKNIGHPQILTEDKLNKWLGGEGRVKVINENGAVGKCYSGVFKGKHYEK